MSTRSHEHPTQRADPRWFRAMALMDLQDRLFGEGQATILPQKIDAALEQRKLRRGLIPHNVDLDARDLEYGRTLLARAACRGSLEEVRLWMPGSNPNAADLDAMTCLMHAAIRADGAPIVAELLAAGASPEAICEQGRDALGWAIQFGNDECARVLLGRLDARGRDGTGMTRLMSASVSRATPERAWRCALLLIPLSDLDALDPQGMSALDHASRSRNHGVAGAIRAALERRELDIDAPVAAAAVKSRSL